MATYQRVVTETSDGVISQNTTGNAATASAVAYSGLTGSVPTWNQDTTGNADTASALARAVAIGGVSFDGSSAITLPGVNDRGNQDTTGNSATATKLATAITIGGVSFDGSANINLPGVNSAGNQNTSGRAATASALASAGGISISGDATASKTTYTSGGDIALSLSLGADVVGASELADNSVAEANLMAKSGALGSGRENQFLACAGSGVFKWMDQTSANDARMSVSAGAGLSGGGAFTGNQSSDSSISIALDASVAGAGLSHSSGVLSVDASQAITGVTGDFAIAGDLTVSGKTITTTTEELEINDNTLKLNADSKSAVDAGFIVETNADSASSEKGMLFYDASAKRWMAGTTTSGAFSGSGVKALEVQVRNVRDSFDANDTDTPIGGFQVVGGSIFLRTS